MNNNWFKVKAKFVKQLEDGRLKRVTDQFLVDAVSHTEAEERTWKELLDGIQGEVLITGITPQSINDVISFNDEDNIWWECVFSFRSIDGDTGNETTVKNKTLISAGEISEALKYLKEHLQSFTVNTHILSIKETSIVEVLPYKPIND